jgi:cytochrome c peroxidase
MTGNQITRMGTVFFTVSFLFVACKKDVDDSVAEPLFEVPSHFPAPRYTSERYPLSIERISLGRKLFYDPILSLDSSVSCGSCHAQTHAFADHNTPFSSGVNGALGLRNTPALSNLAWYPSFMQDGGINHLEVMPLAPITDVREMNIDLSVLLERLNAHDVYSTEFKQAFGESPISSSQLFIALAQFQMTLVSASSKYDQFILGKAVLDAHEKQGEALFMEHCATCHTPPLFTDFSYVNTGLDVVYADAGRGRITLNGSDSGAFRVPSLRNIALTYPYMHDGRFFTLRSVLDHYAGGVVQNGRLDARLQGNIVLSEMDKERLIAFLNTLTDYEFLSNSNFSEP